MDKFSCRVVLNAAQKIQMDYESGGHPQEVVFNNNMVSLVRAAKVGIDTTVYSQLPISPNRRSSQTTDISR